MKSDEYDMTKVETLSEVADHLRSQGYTVTIRGQTLTVKLPMFCSVSAKVGSSGTRLSAKFGMVSRSTGIIISSALVAYWFYKVIIKTLSPMFIPLLIAAVAWDVQRWRITQREMNRIEQMLGKRRVV